MFVTHSVDEAVYLSERVLIMTTRPSEIKSVVTIELNRSRNREQIVTSPEFSELRNRVWLEAREEVLKYYESAREAPR